MLERSPDVSSNGVMVLPGLIEPGVTPSDIEVVVAGISDEAVLALLETSTESLTQIPYVQSDESKVEEATDVGGETVKDKEPTFVFMAKVVKYDSVTSLVLTSASVETLIQTSPRQEVDDEVILGLFVDDEISEETVVGLISILLIAGVDEEVEFARGREIVDVIDGMCVRLETSTVFVISSRPVELASPRKLDDTSVQKGA